jgi:hypothetical protein
LARLKSFCFFILFLFFSFFPFLFFVASPSPATAGSSSSLARGLATIDARRACLAAVLAGDIPRALSLAESVNRDAVAPGSTLLRRLRCQQLVEMVRAGEDPRNVIAMGREHLGAGAGAPERECFSLLAYR